MKRRHLPRLRAAGSRMAAVAKRVPLAERLEGGVQQGLLSAAAAMLAWLPTQVLGLREGFWAAITAVAVAQTEFNAARSTARDQFAGAALGGSVAVGIALAVGQGPGSVVLAIVLAIGCCWLLNVASAARLAGITAIIILLVPHQGSAVRMMASRVSEVGWGVCMAIAVVWTAMRLRASRDGTGAA